MCFLKMCLWKLTTDNSEGLPAPPSQGTQRIRRLTLSSLHYRTLAGKIKGLLRPTFTNRPLPRVEKALLGAVGRCSAASAVSSRMRDWLAGVDYLLNVHLYENPRVFWHWKSQARGGRFFRRDSGRTFGATAEN